MFSGLSERRERLLGVLLGALVALFAPGLLTAQLPSVLRVSVRSADSDIPVSGAVVEAVGSVVSDRTDDGGLASLRGLTPGAVRIRIRALGYRPAEVAAEALNGRTVDVAVRLEPQAVRLDTVQAHAAAPASGAAVSVLTPADAGPEVRDLAGLLAHATGIEVIRPGGPGAPVQVSIRGSASSQVLVLLDGIPLNSPLTGEADLSQVDLSSVKRVVVQPGATARYGARALAGVIQIESRESQRTSMSANLTGGTFDTWSGGGDLSIGGENGLGWSGSAGGSMSRSDGDFSYPVPMVRGGGIADRINGQHTARNGYALASWNGAAWRVHGRAHLEDTDRGSPGTVVQPSATGHNWQQLAGVTLSTENENRLGRWTMATGYQRARAHFFDAHPPFGGAFDDRSDVHQLEARLEWNRAISQFQVQGGLDARRREVNATSLPSTAPRTLTDAGGWGRVEYRPGGRSFWISGEMRLDHDALVNDLVLSPKVAIGKTVAGVVGEIAVGNAFAPPGLSDLFFQEGVLIRANPSLAPERVRGEITASLSRTFSLRSVTASLFAAAYRADVTGMILWFPDFRFVWSPNNFDVRRRGVDVGGEVRSARSVAYLSARASFAQVTYAGSTLSGQVVYRPEATGHAETGVRVGAIVLSAAGQYVGRRRTVAGSPLNTLDPYVLMDGGISLTRRFASVVTRFQFSVQNLFDKPAAILADYPLPGRSLSLRIDLGTARGIRP